MRALPVCADESCHDRASLPALRGNYDMVNIKLDKTGGLTEALALKAQAAAQGYGMMVGCMVGTSLAMACNFFDMDLLLVPLNSHHFRGKLHLNRINIK